jgi:hypothetical protein
MAEVGSRRNILWRKVEGEEAGRVMHPQIGLSLLMVGLLLGTVSCGDNQGPTPSGSVEITTATTGPDPDADGYEITIDEGSQAAIGTNASLRHDNLAPGTHAVLLT